MVIKIHKISQFGYINNLSKKKSIIYKASTILMKIGSTIKMNKLKNYKKLILKYINDWLANLYTLPIESD